MKVVYGNRNGRWKHAPALEGDVIELLWDNWDDYTYKTSFPTSCRIAGEHVELSTVKLLIDGVNTTSARLDELLAGGWDGVFPIPDVDYISVPTEITFYELLESRIGIEATRVVARQLRDASFLTHIEADEAASRLTKTEGFRNSLQRERGAIKAFLDGWQIFESLAASVESFDFQFTDVFGEISSLGFKFESPGPLPHDINVLIGANGVGKSQLMHQIVREWIKDPDDVLAGLGFAESPNLSQIVVVSYSPFEQFPLDLRGRHLADRDVYKYFGFRGRIEATDQASSYVELSHAYPKRNAAASLLFCASDDRRYGAMKSWPGKLKTLGEVLSSAIVFDSLAVRVSPEGESARFEAFPGLAEPVSLETEQDGTRQRFVVIGRANLSDLDLEAISEGLLPDEGVFFLKDGQQVALSSGQRLFAYIVINVLGAIRRNSLILVDEPELFLHPTLEIQFIEMLKAILTSLQSKAILATHSVVTVREMPSDCVHVFERTSEGLVVKNPPFQTFGGDVQRISSYVFGDRAAAKPYEAWIRSQLAVMSSADALIEALGSDVNEELLIQIRAMAGGRW